MRLSFDLVPMEDIKPRRKPVAKVVRGVKFRTASRSSKRPARSAALSAASPKLRLAQPGSASPPLTLQQIANEVQRFAVFVWIRMGVVQVR